jgi:hypothetical protein
MAEFLKAGFPVLIPLGENTRYDLVVDAGGRFLRVQCKTASSGGDGAICFNARSIRLGGPRSAVIVAQSYRGQADLFGVYAPCTGKVYVLAVDDVPETRVWLRLTPARNNQKLRIRLAEDHTLDAWAARLLRGRDQGVAAARSGPGVGSPVVELPKAPGYA